MPEQRDLITAVIQLGNLLNKRLGPLFQKANVTPQQYAVLTTLAGQEQASTLAALARAMLVSKQNMTGMVARLIQLGLVERSDDPHDLRSARIELTRRGKSLVERVRPAYQEWHDQLGSDLSDRDLAAFDRALQRMIGKLSEE